MKRFFFASLAWTCLNCGSTDTQKPQSGSGGAQQNGSGGSADGSGGRTAGSGGAAEGSGGEGLGGAGPDEACSGAFGSPRVILSGGRVTSPALSADNLELFYVVGESYEESFMVSHRNSADEAFPEGVALPELNDFPECVGMNKTLDASADGLRVYVSCYTDVDLYTELYQFERPDRDALFANPAEVGLVFASSGISVDELTFVGARFTSDVATSTSTRTALDRRFPDPQPLPGLENQAIFGPTLSRDSLELYGALGTDKTFVVVRRPDLDTPFGTPEPLTHLIGDLMTAGAPDLSDDCSTLVFVGVDYEIQWAIYQADR